MPPVTCTVTVTVNDELAVGAMECEVNGCRCRYDQQTEAILQEYVGGDFQDAGIEAEYVALLCRHALCLQPAILVNERIIDEWRRGVPAPLSREDARLLLTGLLEARVRVDDYQAIAKLVVPEKPVGELLEECLGQFSKNRITLRVAAQYHDAIFVKANEPAQIFDGMRQELYEELGVLCPFITVQSDPVLRDRGFELVINAASGTPRAGIAPGRVHVNDTVDCLRLMNVVSTAWPSPDRRRSGALVSPDQEEMLTAAGRTVLNPLQYIAGAVQEDLRRNASLLVHETSLTVLRTKLAAAFPALVDAASAAVPFWQLTAALRELARDRVPVRGLTRVMERVVDFPFSAFALNRYIIGEERIYSTGNGLETADLVSFLRAGLAREIAWASSRRTSTLVVYLADERELAPLHESGQASFEETVDRFVRAFEEESRHLPPTAHIRCLLAAPESARRLRPILRLRLPQVVVLSCADLPADVNVQPVARIGR